MQMIMSMYRTRVRTRAGKKKALGIFRAQKGALRKKGVSYVRPNSSPPEPDFGPPYKTQIFCSLVICH
jgi:hypothetical protein